MVGNSSTIGGRYDEEETKKDAWHGSASAQALLPREAEKTQISVDKAEELYREIRIENV